MVSAQSARGFCSRHVDPFVRPSQTMNLLRLSGANEPQSGVGLKFIFCGARSGLASGRGHRRPSVAFCRAEWQFLINSNLSWATRGRGRSVHGMVDPAADGADGFGGSFHFSVTDSIHVLLIRFGSKNITILLGCPTSPWMQNSDPASHLCAFPETT